LLYNLLYTNGYAVVNSQLEPFFLHTQLTGHDHRLIDVDENSVTRKNLLVAEVTHAVMA
jgi:hypothetical protein